MTLDEWEEQLKQRLTEVQLLGELNVSPGETDEITRRIRGLVRALGAGTATRRLEQKYPCVFVTYLVFRGMYGGYTKGDYWSAVCEDTGLPERYTQDWGQAFESIIGELGLSHEFAGHRYVGAILGHGGIPEYSLPDFFEYMLQPAVTEPELSGLSTRELITEWLNSSRADSVDKPIIRFLEYGGRVAEDFVARCMEMARETSETGVVPRAHEMQLPRAVVTVYESWLQTPEQFRSQSKETSLRVRRPRILIDPWGIGVFLRLPEQRIPASMSTSDARWELMLGEKTRVVSTRLRRSDLDLKTNEKLAPFEELPSRLSVRFILDAEAMREWSYPDFTRNGGLSYLAFDPNDGQLMSDQRDLPDRHVWLLVHPDATLNDDGIVEEYLPRLPWQWNQWNAFTVDLSNVKQFSLDMGGEKKEVTIRSVTDPPFLDEAEPLLGENTDEIPLFVGSPPTVHIPRVSSDYTHSSPSRRKLSRWRLDLINEWDANPPCDIGEPLDRLSDVLRYSEESVDIPLRHPNLLGRDARGQYRVRVRGPLGTGSEFRFRVIPQLTVVGNDSLYMPDDPAAHLLLEVGSRDVVELLEETHDIKLTKVSVSESGKCYEVVVPSNHTNAPIRIVHTLASKEKIYVPLRIPIRRIRWMLMLRTGDANWTNNPVLLSMEELEQSSDPYLVADVPVDGKKDTSVHLHICDDEGKILQEIPSSQLRGQHRFHRFDLRPVKETIRQSDRPAIEAKLVIDNLPDETNVELSTLRIRRGVFVESVSVTTFQQDGQVCLELQWAPQIRLRSRQVRFWTLTRPWETPGSFGIPDSASGNHVIMGIGNSLPPGDYLVEFRVDDPWIQEKKIQRPARTAQNVAHIVVGTREVRLRQLAEALSTASEFRLLAERALLYHFRGESSKCRVELDRCYRNIELATLDEIMSLVKALPEESNVKAMRYTLFRTHRIREIVQAYETGNFSNESLDWYQVQLKRHYFSTSFCKSEDLLALLKLPRHQVRLAAVRKLIAKEQREGFEEALRLLEQAQLSEDDALELFSVHPDQATGLIVQHELTSAKLRLLERLTKAHSEDVQPLVVKTGYWVRCQAGWGKISRIEDEDDQTRDYVRTEELKKGYRLFVTLRPSEDAEPVIVDAARSEVHFRRATSLYLCSKCDQFAASRYSLITHEHTRYAHELTSPGFRQLRDGLLRQASSLEFSVRRPSNVWR